jgi:hypothetical protein
MVERVSPKNVTGLDMEIHFCGAEIELLYPPLSGRKSRIYLAVSPKVRLWCLNFNHEIVVGWVSLLLFRFTSTAQLSQRATMNRGGSVDEPELSRTYS